MGHLDNSKRTIEVRLTSTGRKRLAEGKGIDITQFALSDDEINYGLWQSAPSVPPEDRGALIENLPVFEAFTDETQAMRHKLITLEDSSSKVPELSVPKSVKVKDSPVTVTPSTQIDGEDVPLDRLIGYTVMPKDDSFVQISATEKPEKTNATVPALYKQKFNENTSQIVGTKFQIQKSGQIQTDKTTKVTFVGNETGLSFVTNINVIST